MTAQAAAAPGGGAADRPPDGGRPAAPSSQLPDAVHPRPGPSSSASSGASSDFTVGVNVGFLQEWLPFILGGVWITLFISVVSIFFAVLLAVFGALGRLSSNPYFNGAASLYVSIVRGTPLIVQILFIFLALPAAGIVVPPLPTGIIALAFNYGAYLTEVFRAGIQAVPGGQVEAARALGLPESGRDAAGHPSAGDPDRHAGGRQRLHRDDEGLGAGLDRRRPGAPVARPGRRTADRPELPDDHRRGADVLVPDADPVVLPGAAREADGRRRPQPMSETTMAAGSAGRAGPRPVRRARAR